MKWLQRGLLLLISLAVPGLLYLIWLTWWLPDVGKAENIHIPVRKERIQRGQYLAYAVAACFDCHSSHDTTRFSGPIIPGTLGRGGEIFDQSQGYPGRFISKNITPFHLGQWTDGEILRAITTGVSKDGHALYPCMPYQVYGTMDKQDICDIIAYLRTIPAIAYTPAPSQPDFTFRLTANTIPAAARFTRRPPLSDTIGYGRYLVQLATCAECHSHYVNGVIDTTMGLSGGTPIPLLTGGIQRPANITPDKQTGIGNWSKAYFISRFKAYAVAGYIPPRTGHNTFNTIMPWTQFAQMTTADLGAIYSYLQSCRPIKNEVTRFTPAE